MTMRDWYNWLAIVVVTLGVVAAIALLACIVWIVLDEMADE